MADIAVGVPAFTINSADRYIIGNGSDAMSSLFAIQGTSAAFAGTGIVVVGRVHGANAGAWVALPYVRRDLAGTGSDDTTVIAALTNSFLIRVEASGLDVALDASAGGWSGGSMAVNVSRVEGGLR
jgi:hypothetical protein